MLKLKFILLVSNSEVDPKDRRDFDWWVAYYANTWLRGQLESENTPLGRDREKIFFDAHHLRTISDQVHRDCVDEACRLFRRVQNGSTSDVEAVSALVRFLARRVGQCSEKLLAEMLKELQRNEDCRPPRLRWRLMEGDARSQIITIRVGRGNRVSGESSADQVIRKRCH